MPDFPAMPLWTDAYLADTTHLTHEEHGRYLLMLIHLWRMPEKRFPNDDAWLARKFGCSREDVATLWRPLLAEFFTADANGICQKRLAREWHRLRNTSARQSAAAKSRWDKEKGRCHGNAALALQPQPQERKKEEGEDSTVEVYSGLNGSSTVQKEESKPCAAPNGATHDRIVDLDAALFKFGVSVLGEKNRSVIGRLKKSRGTEQALHIIERARTREDPLTYVLQSCRKNSQIDDGFDGIL